jgi:hypothetical protein
MEGLIYEIQEAFPTADANYFASTPMGTLHHLEVALKNELIMSEMLLQ